MSRVGKVFGGFDTANIGWDGTWHFGMWLSAFGVLVWDGIGLGKIQKKKKKNTNPDKEKIRTPNGESVFAGTRCKIVSSIFFAPPPEGLLLLLLLSWIRSPIELPTTSWASPSSLDRESPDAALAA